MSIGPLRVSTGNEPVVASALEDARRLSSALLESAPVAIYYTDATGEVQYLNPEYRQIFSLAPEQNADEWARAVHPEDRARMERSWAEFRDNPRPMKFEYRTISATGTVCYLAERIVAVNGASGFVGSITDVSQQKKLELELAQSQKLEAIGQLSAGIAHEINTPTQFIGDNIRFLHGAFGDLLAAVQELAASAESQSAAAGSQQAISTALAKADLPYLLEEVPKAIGQSLEGVGRIAKIVGAMKEFSHPGTERTPLDLNRAISTTITVASNEWKYVAVIQTDFDAELPPVAVLPGAFNQAILNIIVNASHALAMTPDMPAPARGIISLSTRRCDSCAEIRISDTGCGIPAAILPRIFDPFFTTKPVGKGTGQGLAIVRDVIIKQHGGTITVDSTPGVGTTFILRLPLAAELHDSGQST